MAPNILFIFSDQHRHNVMGCAGHPLVETPNLDRLASESVRFTRTWCQSPICQPSRASVITGRYAHELGVIHNTGGFNPEWPTVMKQLQSAGYETATIGKTHYHESYKSPKAEGEIDMRSQAGFVSAFGWDYVLEEYDKYLHCSRRLTTPYTEELAKHGYLDKYREQIKSVFRLTPEHWRGATSVLPQELDLTSFLADHACNWLRGRATDKPFMLKLAFVQPHVPLIDDPVWAAHYADADIEVPSLVPAEVPNEQWGSCLAELDKHSQAEVMDEDFVRNGIRHYLGMVSLMDQKIGEVIETLEALDQLKDTWIVYCCDHGEMLGEHRLWAKMNFYKGAVQVPLIIRPPGGTTAREEDALTELTDVTATLADIGNVSPPEGCQGQSLLSAFSGSLEGREYLTSRIGEYAGLRQEDYRFTTHVDSGTPCELFDMVNDPDETRNLVNEAEKQPLVEVLNAQLLAHET
jgi:choline-sulfatase